MEPGRWEPSFAVEVLEFIQRQLPSLASACQLGNRVLDARDFHWIKGTGETFEASSRSEDNPTNAKSKMDGDLAETQANVDETIDFVQRALDDAYPPRS